MGRRKLTPGPGELVQGTLDMLVLKVLSLEAMHGWGIAQRIRQVSGEVLRVEEGSLYPALRRLEQEGWVRSSWSLTESQRKARVYSLTPTGRLQLDEEEAKWQKLLQGVRHVLRFAE
jgi:transcriptional regulator